MTVSPEKSPRLNPGAPLVLAVLDLDDFKAINDTHGHHRGDEVLAAVASALRAGRRADTAFRLGGDEFAVLMPNIGLEGARHAMQRRADALAQDESSVAFSVGLALLREGDDTGREMWEHADEASYAAKRLPGTAVLAHGDPTAREESPAADSRTTGRRVPPSQRTVSRGVDRVGTVTGDPLAGRLAARTLELIDIPSESRGEDALAAHVTGVLQQGGVKVQGLGDTCVLAGPPEAKVLLAGHLDTVPTQGNRPGASDSARVHGLGASDMKGALAVMVELALDHAPFRCLFFGREELPVADSALGPLLARELEAVRADLVLMMEPTDNQIHAGCLGNINATWTFRGRSGHSARPWDADNAITKAAAGISALAAHPPDVHEFNGLTFTEVASVTTIAGGIARNVIPDETSCGLNFRYAPGRAPDAAVQRLHELVGDHGEITIDSNAPSGRVPAGNDLLGSLISHGELAVLPKQAWTPVAEFATAGLDAVNFGPGAPSQAHRRDESIEISALVACYELLRSWMA